MSSSEDESNVYEDEVLSEGEEVEPTNWEDWNAENEQEEDEQGTLCLFSDAKHSSPQDALQFAKANFGFDFHQIRKEQNMDFYDGLKLINFIRKEVAAMRCMHCGAQFDSPQQLLQHMRESAHFKLPPEDPAQGREAQWRGEEYLTPWSLEDPLLFGFEDEEDFEGPEGDEGEGREGEGEVGQLSSQPAASSSAPGPESSMTATDLLLALKQSQSHLRHEAAAKENLSATLAAAIKLLETASLSQLALDSHNTPPTDPLASQMSKLKVEGGSAGKRAELLKEVDQTYFDSYSRFTIHREMISDQIRTDAYRDAIECNPTLIKGARVLDVGCGTGILSLFACRAGATQVTGVDGSAFIAEVARRNAKDNGYMAEDEGEGGVMQVVQGKLEEIDLPGDKVDVLVSEWMGYALLYESMLDTVLAARDRYLKPGGAMLPDTATIFIAGVNKDATSMAFWDEVYGFDMSHIGHKVHESALKEAVVTVVDASTLVTPAVTAKHFDLTTMQQKDVNFVEDFILEPLPGASGVQWCYGIVLWFDTGFTSRYCSQKPVNLSTGPQTKATHWAQTLLYFKEPIAISCNSTSNGRNVGTAEFPASGIKGKIAFTQGTRQRNLDITLEYQAVGGESNQIRGINQVNMYEL